MAQRQKLCMHGAFEQDPVRAHNGTLGRSGLRWHAASVRQHRHSPSSAYHESGWVSNEQAWLWSRHLLVSHI